MYLLILYTPLIYTLIILIFGSFIGNKGNYIINIILNSLYYIYINIILYEIIIKGINIEININKLLYSELILINISIVFDNISILISYLIVTIYIIIINYSI